MHPNYYKTNLDKMSVGELWQWKPDAGGLFLCVFKALGLLKLPTIPGYIPQPTLAETFFCDWSMLSDRAQDFIQAAAERFEQLDFDVLGYETIATYDPNIFDTGACHLQHRSGNFAAGVTYLNTGHLKPAERLSLWMWTKFASGNSLGVTSNKLTVNPYNNRILKFKSFVCHTETPAQLFDFFNQKLFHYHSENESDEIVSIAGREDYARLVQERSETVLRAGLAGGRFIPMTTEEIENVKKQKEEIERFDFRLGEGSSSFS